MQDKLYVNEDIPEDYKFMDFHEDYIDIYNKSSFRDETTTVYRIYHCISPNTYYTYSKTFGNYQTYTYQEYPRTSDICYRTDFPQICNVVFIFSIFFIFLLNIITSIFKKGGVLSGLL